MTESEFGLPDMENWETSKHLLPEYGPCPVCGSSLGMVNLPVDEELEPLDELDDDFDPYNVYSEETFLVCGYCQFMVFEDHHDDQQNGVLKKSTTQSQGSGMHADVEPKTKEQRRGEPQLLRDQGVVSGLFGSVIA